MKPRVDARGAVVVEFALVVWVLVMLLLGLLEAGRAVYTWNSAVDATRRGARMASIAAVGDTDTVLAEMRAVLPGIEAANVVVEYSIDGNFPGAACVRGTCRYVRVTLAWEFRPLVHFLPGVLPLPTFGTTSPVEALGAT